MISCWVIVEPPSSEPLDHLLTRARRMALGSTPLWSKKRLSSIATTALRRPRRSGSASAPDAPRPAGGLPIRIQQPFAPARASRALTASSGHARTGNPTCAGSRAVNWSRFGAFCATAVMNPNSEETIASSVSRASTNPNRSHRIRRRRASRGGGGGRRGRLEDGAAARVAASASTPWELRPGRTDNPRGWFRGKGGIPRLYPAADAAPDAIIDDLRWRGQLFQYTEGPHP